MTKLRRLTNEQLNQALVDAVQERALVTISLQSDNGWINLHSRLLSLRYPHIFLAVPQAAKGKIVPEIKAEETLGLSFKLGYYKHTLTTKAVGVHKVDDVLDGGHRVLQACWPREMYRLQRRAYRRVDVPAGRVVEASLWPGGRQDEPPDVAPDRPVWEGRVINISAGGAQILIESHQIPNLDVGDMVGVKLTFAGETKSIYSDTEFRQQVDTGGRTLMSFKFVGLDGDSQGREVLDFVATKVAEYRQGRSGFASASPEGQDTRAT